MITTKKNFLPHIMTKPPKPPAKSSITETRQTIDTMEIYSRYSPLHVREANYSEVDKIDRRRKTIVSDKYAKAVAKRQADPESMAMYKQKACTATAEHATRKKQHIMERSTQYIRILIIVEELRILKESWAKINPKHPCKDSGLILFDGILARPKLEQSYRKPQQYQFKRFPTSAELMRDVTDEDTFYHAVTTQHMEAATVHNFIEGWMHMGDRGNPALIPPLVAMNVQCESKDGLQACMTGLPKSLQKDDVFVSLTEKGEKSLTNVLTTAFTIARPHSDGSGRGQVLLEAYGVKVLIWFIDSEKLREEFSTVHGSSSGDHTAAAISTWPGFRWTILHPGEYIEMDPMTIHMVISPVNAAVCGWYFVKKQWLSDGTFRKFLMWELDLAERRERVLLETEEDPQLILGTIEAEMAHWQVWLEEGILDNESKKELRKLKLEIEKRIKKLKKKNEH
jgi:hypothetical protein